MQLLPIPSILANPNFLPTLLDRHSSKLREELRHSYRVTEIRRKRTLLWIEFEFTIGETTLKAPYRLTLTCPPTCATLEYRQEFDITHPPFLDKSPKELQSLVQSLSSFLQSQRSRLQPTLTSHGIQLHSHCIFIFPESDPDPTPLALAQLLPPVLEFLAHLRYLHQVNFLAPSPAKDIMSNSRAKYYEEMHRLMQFYQSTGGQPLTKEQVRRCEKQAAAMRPLFELPPQKTGPPICEGIRILNEQPAHAESLKRLQKNLQINEAVPNKEMIQLVSISYQPLSTFAHARNGSDKAIAQPSKEVRRETVVKKNAVEKRLEGHRNQLFFLQRHGGLSCRYIVKYFLNQDKEKGKKEKKEGEKGEKEKEGDKVKERETLLDNKQGQGRQVLDASKIPIYSNFSGGDLFTDVMYPQNHQLWNFDLDEYLLIFLQLVQTLQFLTSNHILHRDIKPTNILLTTHQGQLHTQLIDFGSWAGTNFSKEEREKQEYKKVIESQRILRTTKDFSLSYKEAVERDPGLAPIVRDKLVERLRGEEYERHGKFDVFSVGATVRELLRVAGVRNQAVMQVIAMCENPNPDRRPNLQTLSARIVDFRVQHYLQTVFIPRLRLQSHKGLKFQPKSHPR